MLPLTLATFRGVLVESARRTFVVPTAQVERVDAFQAARTSRRSKAARRCRINGRALALARLAEVLELPPAPQRQRRRPPRRR